MIYYIVYNIKHINYTELVILGYAKKKVNYPVVNL